MTTCPGCGQPHIGPRSNEQIANLLRNMVRRSMALGREAVNCLRVQARLAAGELEGLCAGWSWQKAATEIGDDAVPPAATPPRKFFVVDGGPHASAEEYTAASGEPLEPWMRVKHDGEGR